MAFGYCYRCGIRVSSAELEAGFARRLPQGLCCRSCVKDLERKETVEEPGLLGDGVLSPGP